MKVKCKIKMKNTYRNAKLTKRGKYLIAISFLLMACMVKGDSTIFFIILSLMFFFTNGFEICVRNNSNANLKTKINNSKFEKVG